MTLPKRGTKCMVFRPEMQKDLPDPFQIRQVLILVGYLLETKVTVTIYISDHFSILVIQEQQRTVIGKQSIVAACFDAIIINVVIISSASYKGRDLITAYYKFISRVFFSINSKGDCLSCSSCFEHA